MSIYEIVYNSTLLSGAITFMIMAFILKKTIQFFMFFLWFGLGIIALIIHNIYQG